MRCGEMIALKWTDVDLAMTQRYTHLSPAALDWAIRLLEHRQGSARRPSASEGVWR